MRLMMLGGIAFVALLFAFYVGLRNTGAYTCTQPSCTLPDKLWHGLWSVAYAVVTWLAVIFLAVGGRSSARRTDVKKDSECYFERPSAIARPLDTGDGRDSFGSTASLYLETRGSASTECLPPRTDTISEPRGTRDDLEKDPLPLHKNYSIFGDDDDVEDNVKKHNNDVVGKDDDADDEDSGDFFEEEETKTSFHFSQVSHDDASFRFSVVSHDDSLRALDTEDHHLFAHIHPG
mmetsp:Transcript_24549/g.75834  ORF Transcript_24549/g.75834 Transcript_24549/m.75834 type:complete len:234 (-) Transcript_24549:158-859(-)